jgi:hypothetical protein
MVISMEAQIIQARTQVRFVGNFGDCQDCEKEQRQEDALKKDIAGDRVNLSAASLSLSSGATNTDATNPGKSENGEEAQEDASNQAGPKAESELSEEDRRILNELRARDAEVRAHEQAHIAAAGPYANGGPTFEFQTGPDGKQYAVGGEVSIDTSPVAGDPDATIRKAQILKRAALAPRDPSAQDRKVAAQAAQLEAQARQESRAEKAEEQKEATETENDSTPVEENSKSAANSESGNDSNTSTPFARRVTNRFNPSSSNTSGNLLNIIS